MRKPSDLSKARLGKEIWLGRIRQAQARKLEGQLVERIQVEAVWASAFASIRDRVMALPDRISSRGAHRAGPELHAIVTDECRVLLESIACGQLF